MKNFLDKLISEDKLRELVNERGIIDRDLETEAVESIRQYIVDSDAIQNHARMILDSAKDAQDEIDDESEEDETEEEECEETIVRSFTPGFNPFDS